MKAVFLDRDGVINENRPDHVKSWDEFTFLPGAIDALVSLSHMGVPVFVVTNQAVINRGIVTRDTVDWINSRMVEEVSWRGGRIDAVAYCPHLPEEHCSCRKPEPGLLLELARGHGVDLEDSVVIGDTLTDLEAGQAVGCQTIMVLTGRGEEQSARVAGRSLRNFPVVPDLRSAVDLLFSMSAVA